METTYIKISYGADNTINVYGDYKYLLIECQRTSEEGQISHLYFLDGTHIREEINHDKYLQVCESIAFQHREI
jgi:hypothetical protein